MKRKYITAVFLLLSLGVLSTLAISYNTETLDESWGIEYTLNYDDAELTLSNPDTELLNASSIQVTLDASHSTSDVKARLVITALDGSGEPIAVDTSGANCQVEFKSGSSVVETVLDGVAGATPANDFTTEHDMTSASAVDQVVITWYDQESLRSDYEAAKITVTDLE
jgi:hypothetical protein